MIVNNSSIISSGRVSALQIKPSPTVAMRPVSFAGDSFTRSLVVLDGKLDRPVEDALKDFSTGNKVLRELGYGYQAQAYALDVKAADYPHGLVVKTSHDKTYINEKGETITAGNTFIDENEAFKVFWKHMPEGFKHSDTIKVIALAKNDKGRHFLVINRLLGKEVRKLDPSKEPIKKVHIEKMLEDLYLADVSGVLHTDLNWKNVLLDEKNDVLNIIDYEAFRAFDPLNTQENEELYRFPEFQAPSNLRKFEDKTLMHYLRALTEVEGGKEKANTLFKQYLNMRAKFHEKKVDYLAGINADNKLDQAIEFEKLQAKLLQFVNDPDHQQLSDDLTELEFAKIKISHMLEHRYSKNYQAKLKRKYESLHTSLQCKNNIRQLQRLVNRMKVKYADNADMQKYLGFLNQYAESRNTFSLKTRVCINPFEMVTRVIEPGRFKPEEWEFVA